jgi:hypothetical protein
VARAKQSARSWQVGCPSWFEVKGQSPSQENRSEDCEPCRVLSRRPRQTTAQRLGDHADRSPSPAVLVGVDHHVSSDPLQEAFATADVTSRKLRVVYVWEAVGASPVVVHETWSHSAAPLAHQPVNPRRDR